MATYIVSLGGIKIEKVDGDNVSSFMETDGLRYANMSIQHVAATEKVVSDFIQAIQKLGEDAAKGKGKG